MINKVHVQTVYKHLYNFVLEGQLQTQLGLPAASFTKVLGRNPVMLAKKTMPGLLDFDRAYNKIKLNMLFKQWNSQIASGVWTNEITALFAPVIVSLIVISLYTQIYPKEVNNKEAIATMKAIELNLLYIYKMGLSKISKIDKNKLDYDKHVQNIKAYIKTRRNRYKQYLRHLLSYIQTELPISKV